MKKKKQAKKHRRYFRKKIVVNKEGNFVWAYFFLNKKDMRNFYKQLSPDDREHNIVGGVAINREMFKCDSEKKITLGLKSKQSGFILTCADYAGAGVVCHEIMHAVLFADGISKVKIKKQYPIIIKSMNDEERLLYAFTNAIRQYYTWYYRIIKKNN